MTIQRGTFQIWRVDGSKETVRERPTIDKVHNYIGCQLFDTVTIDRQQMTIMLVDDTGLIDGKPINQNATNLVRSSGKAHNIHGDVAIVNDEDFA